MYEATFAIADSSPYTEPTGRADCWVELWCNDHADLLYVAGSTIDPVVERIRDDIGIAAELRVEGEAVVVTDSCLKGHETMTIEGYLESHDCLLLPPLRYENGRKHCRILALDSASLTDLYADLVDDGYSIDVRSKREVDAPTQPSPLVSMDGLLPELTGRQRTVLTLAVEGGYYELPRETTTQDLAGTLDLSRRTVEDHLRRAERKLIPALVGSYY